MPIYEYKCQKCGTFEVTQRITEKPLGKCPACKGTVKKLISNTSFQLKGTGWYLTDYARKDNGAGKGANGSKSSSDSKDESKTKSKTESKTESSSISNEKSTATSSSTST